MTDSLSKSLYCSGVQCPKMLWLKKHRPELFDDSVIDQAVLDTGSEVGDLAMGLFGDFTEVPYGELSGMIRETERLLDAGDRVIAEASFSCDGLFCSVDLLDVRIYLLPLRALAPCLSPASSNRFCSSFRISLTTFSLKFLII